MLLEAGLIGSGSVQGVLTGKHYERAVHCHKILLEGLERILLEQFLDNDAEDTVFANLPDELKDKINNLTQFPSKYMMEEIMSYENCIAYIRKYIGFKQKVRDGELEKPVQFWMFYMDHIWLVLSLIRSVKNNDFKLYEPHHAKTCLRSLSIRSDSNQPDQLQKLARISKLWI